MDGADDALDVGLHLVHEFHRLEDAERLSRTDGLSLLDERLSARLWGPVERSDHRRLDPHDAVRRRDGSKLGVLDLPEWRLRPRTSRLALLGPAHGDAHARLFDRDLADPRFLNDTHELADPFCARVIDAAGSQRLLARGAAADRPEQR